MDRLSTREIQDAGLADWRKLSQRFHARFRVPEFPEVEERPA